MPTAEAGQQSCQKYKGTLNDGLQDYFMPRSIRTYEAYENIMRV